MMIHMSHIELDDTQIFKMVQYFIKYHSINNYCGSYLVDPSPVLLSVLHTTSGGVF